MDSKKSIDIYIYIQVVHYVLSRVIIFSEVFPKRTKYV